MEDKQFSRKDCKTGVSKPGCGICNMSWKRPETLRLERQIHLLCWSLVQLGWSSALDLRLDVRLYSSHLSALLQCLKLHLSSHCKCSLFPSKCLITKPLTLWGSLERDDLTISGTRSSHLLWKFSLCSISFSSNDKFHLVRPKSFGCSRKKIVEQMSMY